MKNYQWNIDYINKKIQALVNSRQNPALSPQEKEQLRQKTVLYDMLALQYYHEQNPSFLDYDPSDIFDFLQEEILFSAEKKEEFELEFQKKCCLSFAKLSPLPKVHMRKISLTQKDMIDLVGSGISEIFGNKHYKIYRKYIKNNPDCVRFTKNSTGTCVFMMDEIKKCYTSIYDSQDLKTISFLAHEAGHIFSHYTQESKEKKTGRKLLEEIESYYYELRFLDYLIAENIYRKEAIKTKIDLFQEIENVPSILRFDAIYPIEKMTSVRDFEQKAKRFELYQQLNCFDLKDTLDIVSGSLLNSGFNYTASAVVTTKLLEDPSMEPYYRMIYTSNTNSPEQMMLNEFGTDSIDKSLTSYEKERTKTLKMYYRKNV